MELDLIQGREVASYLVPLVADLCAAMSYKTVCELMSRYEDNTATKRKELVERLICISESWQRGRLVEGAEICLKNEFSDEPQVIPVSDHQKLLENRLPLNQVQVDWLKRWAVSSDDVRKADHYNAEYTAKELQTIFERLKESDYIAPQTTFEQWQYVCTGRGGNERYPAITWLKSRVLLATMIDTLFDTDLNKWAIGVRAFRLQKGVLTQEALKQALSKPKVRGAGTTKNQKEMQSLLIL